MSIGLVIYIYPRQDLKQESNGTEVINMIQGQLQNSHIFILFLTRVNDGDNLRFSGIKFQSLYDL